MRAAARRYNGVAVDDAEAVTQTTVDESGRAVLVIVRLVEGAPLGVIAHELHHAAAAIYGAVVGDRISSRAHLTHYNEPFAHLFSDLFDALLVRLDH